MGKAKRQRKAQLRASKSKAETLSLYDQLTRNRGWLLLGIFIFAFTIRMVYLAEDSGSPFYAVKGTDSKIYDIRAQGFMNGTWPGRAAFELRPPGYPFFMASVYTIFGKTPGAIKFAQLLLGALSCIFIFLIAEHLFGGVRVPLIAAALYALNGVIIFYDSQLLSGSLDAFLTLLVLLLFLKANRHPSLLWLVLTGCAVGFSIINRGWVLLFLPFGLLWLWLNVDGRHDDEDDELNNRSLINRIKPNPEKIRRCLVVAAVALLPLLMIIWHNAKYNEPISDHKPTGATFTETVARIVKGEFVLLAAGNINLYIGNHPDWKTFNDASIDDAGHFVDFQNLRDEPQKLNGISSVSEKNRYFTQKTLQTIADNPLIWLQLMGRKTVQYFNGNEIARAVTVYAYREYSYLLSLLVWKKGVAFPNGILIPLGLVGLFFVRRSWKQHFPAMAMLFIHVGFLLLFFITARYRLPAIPLFTIYAAFCISILVDELKSKNYRSVMLIVFSVFGVAVISNFNIGPMPGHNPHEYNSLGVSLHKQGKIQQAVDAYKKALMVDPRLAEGHRNLGLVYKELGREVEAEQHAKKAIEFDPAYVDAYDDLGHLYLAQNRLPDAIEMYTHVIQLAPKKTDAYLNLAVVYYKQKNYSLAAINTQAAIALSPNDSQAHYNLARIFLSMGQKDQAVISLRRVLEIDPSNQRSRTLLSELGYTQEH